MRNPPGWIFPFSALEILETLGAGPGQATTPAKPTPPLAARHINSPLTARPNRIHIQKSHTLTYPQKPEN